MVGWIIDLVTSVKFIYKPKSFPPFPLTNNQIQFNCLPPHNSHSLHCVSSTNMASGSTSVAAPTETALHLFSSTSRGSIIQSTTLYFNRDDANQAKLRLSLQNISDSVLHFKFKKSAGTKIAMDPHSSGVIGRHSSNVITIAWDHSEMKPRSPNSRGPYAKMILFLAIDGKFDDPHNSTSARLVGRLTGTKFDPNASADVLIVDSPKMAVTARQCVLSTARSSDSLSTGHNSSQATLLSIAEMDEQERRQLSRWLIFYFIFLILLGIIFRLYRRGRQLQRQNEELINNAK